jgi:hypothetical protein
MKAAAKHGTAGSEEAVMRPVWLTALAPLLLCACVSTGANFDLAAAEGLTPGTSRAEAIRRLGAPTGQGLTPDGREVLIWVYDRKSAFGPERGKSVSFLFDTDGTLLEMLHIARTPV